MRTKPLSRALLAAMLWSAAATAFGHQATELYIPVGQSPGVSNVVTDIGAIEAVDSQARTITVANRRVAIDERTSIYLDRSGLRQRNVTGSFADLQAGRRVEVRYQDPAVRKFARWVKVQIAP